MSMHDITRDDVDDTLRKPIEILHAKRNSEYVTMCFVPIDNEYTIEYGGKRNGKFWSRGLGIEDKDEAIAKVNMLMKDHVKLSEDLFNDN